MPHFALRKQMQNFSLFSKSINILKGVYDVKGFTIYQWIECYCKLTSVFCPRTILKKYLRNEGNFLKNHVKIKSYFGKLWIRERQNNKIERAQSDFATSLFYNFEKVILDLSIGKIIFAHTATQCSCGHRTSSTK